MEPQVSDYEPHSALYAGPTGLEVYERLIPQARRVLKPQGWLMLEIGFGQQPAVEAAPRLEFRQLVHDLQGIPRVLRRTNSLAEKRHSRSRTGAPAFEPSA